MPTLKTEKAMMATFPLHRWPRVLRSPLLSRLLYAGMARRLEQAGCDPVIPIEYDHNEWHDRRNVHEVLAYGFAP